MILSFGTSEGTVSAILSVGTSVDLGEIGDVMMSEYDVTRGCHPPRVVWIPPSFLYLGKICVVMECGYDVVMACLSSTAPSLSCPHAASLMRSDYEGECGGIAFDTALYDYEGGCGTSFGTTFGKVDYLLPVRNCLSLSLTSLKSVPCLLSLRLHEIF